MPGSLDPWEKVTHRLTSSKQGHFRHPYIKLVLTFLEAKSAPERSALQMIIIVNKIIVQLLRLDRVIFRTYMHQPLMEREFVYSSRIYYY